MSENKCCDRSSGVCVPLRGWTPRPEMCPECAAEFDAAFASPGPAAQHRADDEQRQRESEPINALRLASPVFVLHSCFEYQDNALVGIYRTIEDAKADADRNVYGDSQTIHECVGGRRMKLVATRQQIDQAPYSYGLWL